MNILTYKHMFAKHVSSIKNLLFPQPPPHSSKIINEFFLKLLEFQKWIDYNINVIKKEQPPHTRGWPNTQLTELPPFQPPSLQGWFFCACLQDLENATDSSLR